MSSYYDQSYHAEEEAPIHHGGGRKESFVGPSETNYAMGWVEQLRRSKMQKIWKPVRLSLTKNDRSLWVQRDNNMGQSETLQRIPLSSIRSVGLVDEYMGERRFMVMVSDTLDDPQIIFRCDGPSATNQWIATIRTVQEGQLRSQAPPQQPPTPRRQAPPPQVTPPPPPPVALPPPPQDLLSFHIVQQPTRPMQQAPPLPRPFGAADFDPLLRRSASAPVSAPPIPYHHHNASSPQQYRPQYPTHHTTLAPGYYPHQQQRPPPPPPHSAGAVPHWQHNNQQNHGEYNLRQAVWHTWALKPPNRQELRSLDQLVSTVHTTFGLAPHPYLAQQWTVVSYADLTTHHVLDPEKVDKAVRKLRAVLHPDKWPVNFGNETKTLCRILWDVLQNAQEQERKQRM